MKKRFLCMALAVITVFNGCSLKNSSFQRSDVELVIEENVTDTKVEEPIVVQEVQPVVKEIVISAIGDCTLGTDDNFGYERSFTNVLDDNSRDFSYFFSGVFDILSKDDLTIANLETTFTDATVRKEKQFNFKGDLDYTNILSSGSVEAVNLANNHTYDFLEEGFVDTKNALDNANIPYFGYDDYKILDVDGIKIGLAGLSGWDETSAKDNTLKAIDYFKNENTDLIIMTYHWGIEKEYEQNSTQENIAKFAIDSGADLVIGHHPHVLQGVELYNGKYIVYSLGNFVFGGNKNPKDKDTMIFQEIFHFEDGVLTDSRIEIIPCSLSGEKNSNDYRQVVLDGDDKDAVLKKIMTYSNF
ncbi:MAG: CapA family protein [Bacilli bacterium]|nr:CapA family protein [Bacilli bacterium]